MKYFEIRIEFEDYEERFNRLILVQENTSLFDLGVIIGCALKAEFEHEFIIRDNGKTYASNNMIEDGLKGYPLKAYYIEDLSEEFTYIYDMGEDWTFNCVIQEVLNDDPIGLNELAYLIDGRGQGIWEDNKYSLTSYLDGLISDDYKQNEELGFFFPWNFKNNKFSDFDSKFSIKRSSKNFGSNCLKTISKISPEEDVNLKEYDENLKVLDNYFKDRDEVLKKELKNSLLENKQQIIDEYNRLFELYGQERATWIIFDQISLLIQDVEEKKKYH